MHVILFLNNQISCIFNSKQVYFSISKVQQMESSARNPISILKS